MSRRADALEQLRTYIDERGLIAFPEVVVVPRFDEGLSVLLQSHSIGPLKPNLVVLGAPGDPARAAPFARHLHLIEALGMSAVVVMDRGVPESHHGMRIDLWWRGRENGSLMIILAYLITLNWHWRHATIRILRMIPPDASEAEARAATAEIEALTTAARIDAKVTLVRATAFDAAIAETSRDASVVLLGFRPPRPEDASETLQRLHETLETLPTTLLVSSSGEADVFA